MSSPTMSLLYATPTSAPPGSPPTRDFSGPWFRTQLILSLAVGGFSLIAFCFMRPRWKKVYMARAITADANDPARYAERNNSIVGWLMPTVRTSNFAMLSAVGLDAVVFLDFLKTSFYFFSICAVAAALVLMPVNLFRNGSTDSDPDVPDEDDNSTLSHVPGLVTSLWIAAIPGKPKKPSFEDLVIDPQTTITLHLLFTYIFSILALYMLHRNFHRFLRARQVSMLERSETTPARTVIIQNLPHTLREEQALKDYLEGQCEWPVETISVVKRLGSTYKNALAERTKALAKLEEAHWQYGGSWVDEDPEEVATITADGDIFASPQPTTTLLQDAADSPSLEDSDVFAAHWSDIRPEASTTNGSGRVSQTSRRSSGRRNGTISQHRPCTHVPTGFWSRIFPWLGERVDAIEYWTDRFRTADSRLQKLKLIERRPEDQASVREEDPDAEEGQSTEPTTSRMTARGDAFVTFKDAYDAQVAAQVVHYPEHSQCIIKLAPHPEDLVWSNVGMPWRLRFIRDVAALGVTVVGLLFWSVPVTALASLLSFQEIEKVFPWLAQLIKSSPTIGAIVQTTLPSTAIIIFNAVLPYLLEILCYYQGFRSKTDIERSLLKKYTLFLLVTVLFIFLAVSTFWALVRDLAGSPEKIPQRLAKALTQNNARAFSMSYVMLQGIGIMPLQLLNLGTVFTIGLYSLWAKTPRDYNALYAPTSINYGMVYPPAIVVFIMTLVYAVMSPLILVFGAIYFANAYLTYKYKLLHVFRRPASASGEAWPTTFVRLVWGIVVFQLFMTGLFAARGSVGASTGMLPLLIGTILWSWMMHLDMAGLSRYTPISILKTHTASHAEVDGGSRAEEADLFSMTDRTQQHEVAPKAYVQPDLHSKLQQPWLPIR